MKTYTLSDTGTETIEFNSNESQYALVQKLKQGNGTDYKVIVLNHRELMNLYMAIQDSVLSKEEV